MAAVRLKRRSQAGFTLVEILVASVLLAIALLAIATVHRSAMFTQGQTSMRQAARDCALSEIDRLRALPFASLVNGTTTTTPAELPVSSMTVVISSYPNGGEQHLKRVAVTVSWAGGVTRNRPVRAAGQVVQETLVVER